MTPRKRPVLKVVAWVVIILAVLVGLPLYVAWYKLFRQEPQHFDSAEEQFKYGSIGNESVEGLPYEVWRVLPRLFPKYLPGPGGYASFGLIWEEGRETPTGWKEAPETPVGFSKKTVGFPRVGINCAMCHTATYRTGPDQAPTIVPTGPATRLNAQAYLRFLFACASDPRFTPDVLLEAIEYDVKLSLLDKLLYRYVIIPRTRDGLLQQKKRYDWTDSRPLWGRGRIDPFNPVKFHQLGLDPSKDPSIGNSDMEPIWAMAGREEVPLHWDGLNTSLTEVVFSGAIGDGATPQSLPVEDLKRLQEYLNTAQPPKYPYEIDAGRAERGKAVYQQHCAECHESGGKRAGQVIPLDEVNTDRHRLDMWNEAAVQKYNNFAKEYPWRFQHFQKTNGYVAVPLTGLWLRAPYVHNGSVPTLEDLLEPAAKRPGHFYRGYDVYDKGRMGFVHDPEPMGFVYDEKTKSFLKNGLKIEDLFFKFDVAAEANGNGGHEGKDYGTDLPAEEKRDLIEYLKTK